MNAPPFPVNPGVGQRVGSYVWNGSSWVCAPTTGVQVLTTVFTASGPYMPSPGLVSVTVECVGGGGAAGDLPGNAASARSGSGGGSGGYARKTLPAALVLGGVAVTIGAGGAGPGQNPGGATSFGALCVAPGGLPESDYSFGGQGGGGAGSGNTVGIGDFVMPGGPGRNGSSQIVTEAPDFLSGGVGGQMWGGAVVGFNAAGGGEAAGANGLANTGAGGTGGASNMTTGTVNGGGGGSGICIVTEYCWATGTGDDDCLNPPVNVNARVAVTHVPWQGPGPCPPGWGGRDALDFEGE